MENIGNTLKKKRKKVFMDCEFTGLHQNTTLISIGLISECGKIFYSELTDYDKSQIDEWLQTNVIENQFLNDKEHSYDILRPSTGDWYFKGISEHLKPLLTNWLSQFEEVEMWSDCLSYDWVLFNQIFGHAFSIPKNVYYIPMDLSTLFYAKGIDPDISRKEFSGLDEQEHNALGDVRMIKECFYKLQNN